jgi:hypothetical protein
MPQLVSADRPPPAPSKLVFSDRLLRLAEDADRAGYSVTADQLVYLAHSVLLEGERQPRRRHAA